jgi:hypothetical protein
MPAPRYIFRTVTGLLGTYLQSRQGELIDLGQLQQLRKLQLEYDRLQQVKAESETKLAALQSAAPVEAAALSWDNPESWKSLADSVPEHQKELVKLAQAQTKELSKTRVCPFLIPILERAVQLAADGVAHHEDSGATAEVLKQTQLDLGEIKKRYALVRSYKTTLSPRELLQGIIPL